MDLVAAVEAALDRYLEDPSPATHSFLVQAMAASIRSWAAVPAAVAAL